MWVTNYLLIGMILQVPGVFSPGPFDSPLIGGHRQAFNFGSRVANVRKVTFKNCQGGGNLPSTLGMMKSYPRICRDYNNHKPLYDMKSYPVICFKTCFTLFFAAINLGTAQTGLP